MVRQNLGPWPDVATARSFLRFLAGYQVEPGPLRQVEPSALSQWLIAEGIGPLAYVRLPAGELPLPSNLAADAYSAAAETSLHLAILEKISARFADVEIPLVLLKGAALAAGAYPLPEARTMSDIDLWTPQDFVATAVSAMDALGFHFDEKEDRPHALQMMAQGELRFFRPDWPGNLVECHLSPFPGWWLQHAAAVDDAAIWTRIEPIRADSTALQLAPEDMIIHLAVHLAINHQFGLAAVRTLLDIAVSAQTRAVDWGIVALRAQSWRVGVAVWQVLQLFKDLFGLPEVEPALASLRPSRIRRRLLRRFVSAESVLAGQKSRRGVLRLVLLLLLADRPRDMASLVFRALWPEKTWLAARYQQKHGRWYHLWQVLRFGRI